MHNCRNIKIREGKESRSNEIDGRGVRKKMKCVHSLEIPFFNSRAGNSPLEGKDRSYYRGMARVRRIVDEARTKEIRNRWNFSLDRCVQLKNKCRKSRARLSRKNEFSILLLFSSFPPTFCAFIYGLFLRVRSSYFFPLRTFEEERMSFKNEINFLIDFKRP